MWPWSKKKSLPSSNVPEDANSAQEETPVEHFNEPEPISLDQIGEAIIALRGTGAHFGVCYAQMNGYDEKLNNPDRFSEIIQFMCDEPNFTDSGIAFAVECQLEALDFYAMRPEGMSYVIPNFHSAKLLRMQQEEDSRKWARELMAELRRIGGGDLRRGFDEVGFDFRQFLVDTVVTRRAEDIEEVFRELEKRSDVLRPLFLRAYSRGRNKYGEIEYGPIFDEIHDFFNAFFPENSLKFFYLAPPTLLVFPVALQWVQEAQNDDAKPAHGIDFEHWCAHKIEEQGWKVTVSKQSGDQGADIVASRDSISVAIQCKRYSTPVGNKAVQEVFASAKHYGADLAVVIGTGGFTKSALELANSTSVILLDADMIGDFSRQVLDRV